MRSGPSSRRPRFRKLRDRQRRRNLQRAAPTLRFFEPLEPRVLLARLLGFYPFEGDAKDASHLGNDGTVNDATLTAMGFESRRNR